MAAQPRSPAGFWKRYVAYFIDVVLVSIAIDLVTSPFLSGAGAGNAEHLLSILQALQAGEPLGSEQTAMLGHASAALWQMLAWTSLAWVVIGGLYFALMESSPWQATLGKRLIGIKVVDLDGARIGPGKAFGRFFAAGLSWLTMNIGHAMAAFTPERRALHDYVAGTRVDNADPGQPAMPVWGWLVIGAHAVGFTLLVLAGVVATLHVLDAASQV